MIRPLFLVATVLLAACKSDPVETTHPSGEKDRGTATSGTRSADRGSSESDNSTSRDPAIGLTSTQSALVQASADSPETLRRALIDLLNQDLDHALIELGSLKADVDYQVIGDVLYEHFLANLSAAEALEQFTRLDGNLTLATPQLHRFTTRLFEQNPLAAQKFLLENPALNGIEEAAYQIGSRVHDPDDAADQITTISAADLPDDLKASYLTGLANSLLQTDFTRAFETINELDPSPATDRTVYELTQAGANEDPAATMPWAFNIEDPGLQRSAILETANNWAFRDPDAYHNWKTQQQSTIPPDLVQELP